MDKKRVTNLVKEYTNLFKCKPSHAVKSCGRLEVIGNHVDYASGMLINGSIENMSIVGVAGIRNDNKVFIRSKGHEDIELNINELALNKNLDFETSRGLTKGVLRYFEDHGYKKGGFNIIMDSTLPTGVGVSSSAAFSMVVSKTLAMFYNADKKINNLFLALASQWAENTYFGKASGLQDQLGSCSDGLELLDFKDQSNPTIKHFIPDFKDYRIILVKSKTSHANATKAFNEIPEAYRKIANIFGQTYLRFVDSKQFMKQYLLEENIGSREFNRAFHFFNEIKRVEESYNALNDGDIHKFKDCINSSGISNYVFLKNILIPGQETSNLLDVFKLCHSRIKDGAVRIHGGGFGGACFVIINKKELDDIKKEVAKLVGKENIYDIEISEHALEWAAL